MYLTRRLSLRMRVFLRKKAKEKQSHNTSVEAQGGEEV
jgi:hypothetical protein